MLHDKVLDPTFPECPIRNVLARIGDKWSLLVLMSLQSAGGPIRFKQLLRAIPDISEKMLTATLRSLEADGLVSRVAYAEVPPRVEYSLTDRSLTLMPLLNSLVDWSLENFSGIIRDRQLYTTRGGRR